MSDTHLDSETGIMRGLRNVSYKRIGLYALVVFFIAFFLAPIWTGIVTSLKTSAGSGTAFAPPTAETFTLQNWEGAIDELSTEFINSLIMTVPATLLDVLLASMAAYGLTLVDWRYQVPVLALFLVGIFIPYQAVLVPLQNFFIYTAPMSELLEPVWSFTGLTPQYGVLVELILTHVAYGIPICVLLFRSYYKTIPTELIEAAKMDGASLTKVYLRIVLPLSKPMIGVVFIYQFTQVWNEFLFALSLVGATSHPAAPITLSLSVLGQSLTQQNFGLRMAGAFFAALPTIAIYALFAEQFAEGLKQ
jgi:glucose/mannose transport system permease protein